jgi:transcriptional regulator with PAS, ATPase and Fis domain
MIKWQEFEFIHVIKRMRHLLSQWWGIDLFFVDDRANVRDYDPATRQSFSNRIVNLVLSKDGGAKYLHELASKLTEATLHNTSAHLTKEWFPHLCATVVPIIIDKEFVGSVVALGYFKENVSKDQKKKLCDHLKGLGFDQDDVQQAVEKVHALTEDELPRFYELISLVCDEVVTLHKEIGVRDARIIELNKELGTRYKYDSMIGKAKPMQELYGLLDKIAESQSTILVQGENGTGKELIAKAIHYNSPRKDKIFVTQNCSAFNDNLLDSELFGHVKGAFTGAIRDKKGLFETADGGTFFLDEIGDTSPAMQVKLLRVLQEGTFIPVGGIESRKIDVRVICATNKDLKGMVERGEFREDLYYRINVINIQVPPLRDRKEDIPILSEYFLEKAAREKGVKPKILTKRALEKLYDYNFPGNVRELQNEMERVTVLAGDETRITPEMLSARIREFSDKNKVQGVRVSGKLKDALEDLEREMIKEGLKRTNWNKSRLAKELGISRAGLIMKVEKYGLDKRSVMRGALMPSVSGLKR